MMGVIDKISACGLGGVTMKREMRTIYVFVIMCFVLLVNNSKVQGADDGVMYGQQLGGDDKVSYYLYGLKD